MRGWHQLIHNVVVNTDQYADDEKYDHKHLETVGNLTERQENNYGFEVTPLNSTWVSIL